MCVLFTYNIFSLFTEMIEKRRAKLNRVSLSFYFPFKLQGLLIPSIICWDLFTAFRHKCHIAVLAIRARRKEIIECILLDTLTVTIDLSPRVETCT